MTKVPVRFSALEGLHERTVAALAQLGMRDAFPVQAQVIPTAMRGRDVLVQSPTGSGKTLAFGLPLIERIAKGTTRPTAVVLVPTRELAVQVCEDLAPIAQGKQLSVVSVFGGAPIHKQAQAARTAAIVVATPGRLSDLIRSRKIDLRLVRMLVLDEADRMLDMGFQPQVDEILGSLRSDPRQTMLFSATLTGRVGELAASYTNDPETIRTAAAPGAGGEIKHVVWSTSNGTKVDTVLEALELDRDLAVVFVRTKRGADTLVQRLRSFGVRATGIHGGMTQRERLAEYRRFQQGACDVLVATDVFARGMDLDRITLVVNYDLPEDADTYRHRAGRTGRAGRAGTAVTMMLAGQRKALRRMLREAGVALDVFDDVRHTKTTGRGVLPKEQHFMPKARSASERPRKREFRGHAAKPARPVRRDHAPVRTHGGGAGDGSVVSFNSAKGFGFIKADVGGPDVFFHQAALKGVHPQRLRPGLRVTFNARKHERGVRAADVQAATAQRR